LDEIAKDWNNLTGQSVSVQYHFTAKNQQKLKDKALCHVKVSLFHFTFLFPQITDFVTDAQLIKTAIREEPQLYNGQLFRFAQVFVNCNHSFFDSLSSLRSRIVQKRNSPVPSSSRTFT